MQQELFQGGGVKSEISPADGKPMLCAVCKSDKNVEFLTITDCNLCGKCQDKLSEAFEQAMIMDRDGYSDL